MHQVAAIQMCSSHNVEENLNVAEKLIKEAVEQGAVLVVLPEMFVYFGTDQERVRLGEEYGSGIIQDFIANLAQKNDLWIVAGTIPIACGDPTRVRAACIVYNSSGVQVARYDKIHLFDVTLSDTEVYKESATTEPGNDLVVVDTPFGRLGLCVCYDLRFPEQFHQLSKQGIEVIAVPSAFTAKTGQAHWELLARSRAIDTFSYLIGACQGGIHPNGRTTHGHSMIVNPWGEIIKEIKVPGAGIITAEINLDILYKIRQQIPKSLGPDLIKGSS